MSMFIIFQDWRILAANIHLVEFIHKQIPITPHSRFTMTPLTCPLTLGASTCGVESPCFADSPSLTDSPSLADSPCFKPFLSAAAIRSYMFIMVGPAVFGLGQLAATNSLNRK